MLRQKNGGADGSLDFQIKTIKTKGDSDLYRESKKTDGTRSSHDYNRKASFTRAIDQALMEGRIDIAVHSLKDVPIEGFSLNGGEEIEIAAFPKRESPYDVMITKRRKDTLATLPRNAKVGTSSVRRGLQLNIFRPDFEIVPLHGNVQTRIEKLEKSQDLQAIVLAKAGMIRLGIPESRGKILPKNRMLPAVGQGCLAVAVRRKDEEIKSIVSKIDHKNTRTAVSAERAFSARLGGNCNLPIAALATIKKGRILLEGLVESKNQRGIVVRSCISGPSNQAESLGRKLADDLRRAV